MHVNDNIYNIATCWKIETKAKDVIGITSHTVDLTIDGTHFHSKASFTPSELKRSSDLKQNFLSIEGLLSHDLISKNEIETGAYDNAKIDIFLVDYKNPDQFKTIIFSGFFGKISFDDNQYQVEIYSLSDALSTTFGDIYTSTCRAEFCDKKCKLNISDFTFSANVISLKNEHEVILEIKSGIQHDFTGGILEYITSKNIQKKSEIFHQKDNIFKLKNKIETDLKFGDVVTLKLGCDKKFSTCISHFNNALNFRGEPNIPTKQIF